MHGHKQLEEIGFLQRMLDYARENRAPDEIIFYVKRQLTEKMQAFQKEAKQKAIIKEGSRVS